MLRKLIKISIILSLSFNPVFASDIPIIVISPSKKAQSVSTVGTSVTVLDETFFKDSNEFFLGDILAGNSTSVNFFQNGGQGQTSAIQLRGLPKDIQQFILMVLKCQIQRAYRMITILIIF